MPGPLIVGAEGVILIPDEAAYASSRPIQEGLELVLMLKSFPTTSTTIVVNTDKQVDAEYFVKMNGLPNARVLCVRPEDKEEYAALAQWHAINRERARGPINLVVTAHREVYERCTQTHQPVLLFGRRGALSTLEPQASWSDIHARVKSTNEARVEDEIANAERSLPTG